MTVCSPIEIPAEISSRQLVLLSRKKKAAAALPLRVVAAGVRDRGQGGTRPLPFPNPTAGKIPCGVRSGRFKQHAHLERSHPMFTPELLNEQVIFERGHFQRVRRWWRGIHPDKGVVIRGLSGWETVEETDRILAMRIVFVKEA